MQPIYLDNAASTRVADDVLALMTEVMRTAWGNPSSSHPQGAAARTHAGTIVISTVEHAAISTLADRLSAEGRRVIRVAAGAGGVLDPDEVASAIPEGDDAVAGLIMVQNEI